MRTIGVVSAGRADYGIYQPVLRAMRQEPGLRVHLIAAGMHLSPAFGHTLDAIIEDGVAIGDRVDMLLSSDTPEGIAKSMGLGVIGFAQSYGRLRPDLLLAVGDRFEMHTAVLAALPFNIPVAHIHGGELTYGAMDDALRHSITKLSHLHFVSTDTYRQRVLQLGEEPWRVTVSGAPSLDHLQTTTLLSGAQLAERYGWAAGTAPVLVTYHPVTLEHEQTDQQMTELLAALERVDGPIVWTLPNADTHGRRIAQRIRAFVETHPRARLIENLGTQGYFSLMACAAVMVGNSSSGIVEAPSFGLPVVNVGTRQAGRLRAANVIDVECTTAAILSGVRRALEPSFRSGLRGLANPYGDGHAAEKIVRRLAEVPLDQQLLMKRFVDAPMPPALQQAPEVAAHAD